MASNSASPTTLPVIDLSALDAPAEPSQAQADLAQQLDAACRTHGFFYLRGHGLPPALIDAIFDVSRRFFALPLQTKSRWHVAQSGGLVRGYDPIGWQGLEAGRPADLKESFYLGVDRPAGDPLVLAGTPQHGPNTWPDEALVPGFRATCEAYAAAMAQLGHRMMGLLARALGLRPNYFEPFLQDPMPVLRLLQYPPQQESQQTGQIGSGAHTDWGAITLLLQDDAGGLQIMGANGQWFDAPALPGCLVVNLGDLMQRWTHDRYRSNLHRVVHRTAGRSRQSVAYFFDIDYHAVVETLPTCRPPEGQPLRYAPITAGEHIEAMYRKTTRADQPTDA
jgi:isopenicillin N synthase-like dioxygenase